MMTKHNAVNMDISGWLRLDWLGRSWSDVSTLSTSGMQNWPRYDQLEQRLLLNGTLIYEPVDLGDRVIAPAVYGQKFEDLNGNGLREPGEPGINGWTIELLDPVLDVVIASTVTTDIDLDDNGSIDAETESGWYVFEDMEPGEYRVREVLRDDWGQSLPTMPLFQPVQLIDSTGIDDSMPMGTALADLDHDGDLDLIIAHEDYGKDNTMQVLLNDGTGQFTQSGAFGWSTSYKDWRGQVVTGDFNRDSHIDVAMLDEDYHVNVFFNNGSGDFSSPITIHTGGTYSLNFYLAVADVDLDNDLDLLASYRHRVEGDGVSVLRNNGDGTFAAPQRYVTNSEDQFVVIDLNGDQYPDMASGFGSRRYISFNNGDGTFAQVLEFTMPVWGGEFVTGGDLDGDNDNDIVFAADRPSGTEGGAFEIWLNDGEGNLTYLESIETDGNSEIYNVQVGDIDQDGDLDLFGSGSDDTVHVAINQGDATFELGQAIVAIGDNPRGMAVGDINGDGYLDITVPYSSSDQTAVFINHGAAPGGIYRLNVGDDTIYPNRNFGNAEYSQITGQIFEDLNADGIRQNNELPLNGWTVELVDLSTNQVVAVQMTGDIDLNDDGSIDPTTERGIYQFADLWPGDYEVRQFNREGYRQTLPGEYGFASPSATGAFTRPSDMVSADYNGDGLVDLVVAEDAGQSMSRVMLLINNGQADFAAPIVLLTTEQTYTEYLLVDTDADGDGDVDLLVVDDRNRQLIVLLNDGAGNLGVSGYFSIGANPEQIYVADLDGDSRPDVIIANGQDEQLQLMLNLGDGSYADPTTLSLVTEPDPEPLESELLKAMATGDIDGDGDEDLILGVGDSNWGTGPSDIRILLNDGHAGFTESERFDLANERIQAVAVHDWDGDGDLDVLVARDWQTTLVLVNDGTGGLSEQLTTLDYDDQDVLYFSDIDGDGKDDLVMGWNDHLTVVQYDNEQWQEMISLESLAGSPVLLAVDIDSDGLQDFAGLDNTSGQLVILRNTRPTQVTVQSGQSIDSVDFSNYLPNTIRGTLFNDLDGDDQFSEGDEPLDGWTVFIDVDGNGQLGQFLVETQSEDVPHLLNEQSSIVRSTMAVSNVRGFLVNLDISLDLTHSQTSELTLALISPQGYRVELVSAGDLAGADMTDTVFDDQATTAITGGAAPYTGRFVPKQSLDRFAALNPNGTWTLEISDNNAAENGGILNNWSMAMTVTEPAAVTDAAGQYAFFNLPDGTYDIYEQLPLGWLSTAGGHQTVSFAGGQVETLDFVNRQAGPPVEPTLVLVRQPTVTDGLGEADAIPASESWIHEWESFWVEFWVDIPTRSTIAVQGILADIHYQTQYISATEIVYGPAFTENQNGVIDDALGQVRELGAVANPADVVGDDRPVLVARIHFESTASDQVPVDRADRFIGPYDLELSASDVQVQLAGFGTVNAEWNNSQSPVTQLWAIPYDADDNDIIDMADFTELQTAFLLTPSTGEPPYAWWADFDKTGLSDFGDFSYFAPNLGLSKSDGDILFPPGFPDLWNGPTLNAVLTHDTAVAATTNTDRLTSDPTILATVADGVEISVLSARLKGAVTGDWFDLTGHLTGSQLEMGRQLLEQIYGDLLADGDYEIELISENILGNRSTFTLAFTLDTEGPAEASAPDLLAVYDRGISDDDNLTNVTSPTVFVDAQPGQWVRLLVDGQTAVYAPHDGPAELLLGSLDAGEYVLTAIYEDAVGNIGTASQPVVLQIDTDRPNVVAGLGYDTGVSATDGLTFDPQIVITCDDIDATTIIEAQLAATVGFVDITAMREADGEITLDQAALEQINGAVFTDGSYELRVRATDAAGNVSRISLVTFTLDQTPPTVPVFEIQTFYDTDTIGDWHTILAEIAIAGQTEPGVQVSTPGVSLGVPVDAQGGFELADIALSLGDNLLSMTATDAAGNQSVASQTIVRDPAAAVTLADPDLADAIRQQLGRAADHDIDRADMYLLHDLVADSNVIDSLAGLEHAVNLESLTLEPVDYTVTGSLTGLSSLGGLENLESLTLIKLGLNDADLATISQIQPIRQLVLSYNNLTDVSELADLVNLESLRINGNAVGDIDAFASRPVDIDFATVIAPQVYDVAELAQAFHYMPLDIYEYVLNEYEFTPYYGLMKGTQGVLETGAGNDWELAHLLSEMFEESGINTRYVSGMVDADIDDVCNWLGVTTTNAASRILRAAGGFGDSSSAYLFRHTWIEAELLMPGGAYQWVAFDPSWKLKDYQPGIADIVTLVPFDEDDYLSQVRDEMTWEYYLDQVADYLAENQPQASTADVPYAGVIRRQVISAAPDSLPYVVENVSRYDDYSDLSSLAHRAQVTLSYDDTVLFQEMLVLPEVCLEPITITYASAGGGNVIAQLNVGDTVLASGLPIPDGVTVEMLIDHYQPENDEPYHTDDYQRSTDKLIAIGFDANQISPVYLDRLRTRINQAQLAAANGDNEAAASEADTFLTLAVLQYLDACRQGDDAIAGLTQAIPVRSYVRSGTAVGELSLYGNDQLQVPLMPGKLVLDMPNMMRPKWIAIEGFDWVADPNSVMRDRLSSFNNSAQEHAIWQTLASTKAISTIISLQLANERGVEILNINPDNAVTEIPKLNLDAWVINNIQEGIGEGATFTVPVEMTPYGEWHGVGYIIEREDGSVGYIITGSLNSSVPAPVTRGGAAVSSEAETIVEVAQALNQLAVNDPVNIANGIVTRDEIDVQFQTFGLPLTFSRHYDTQSSAEVGLGIGWTHSFSDYLTFHGNSDITWTTYMGNQILFTYDGQGGYLSPAGTLGTMSTAGGGYAYREKDGTLHEFDAQGRLYRLSDRNDNTLVVTYDGNGHLEKAYDSRRPERYLTFTVDGNGRVTGLSDFTGRSWTYQYAGNYLAGVTGPSDAFSDAYTINYGYYTDSAREGLLHTVTDPNGGVTTFDYYANRRAFSITDAEGYTAVLNYDLLRQRTTYIDEHGDHTIYQYNPAGNLIEKQIDHHAVERYEWTDGLMTAEYDVFGQARTYQYNADNDLVTMVDRDGTVTQYTYETTYHLPLTMTVAGRTTRYQYDARGNMTRMEDPLGNVTTMTYDLHGSMTSVTTPRGNETPAPGDFTTTYTYNIDGQVLTRTTDLPSTEQFSYDDRGNLLSETDANGYTTTYEYDLFDNRIRSVDPLDGVTTYDFDAMGNMVSVTDALGHTATFEYDLRNLLVKTTNAAGLTRMTYYDAGQNPVIDIDEAGRVTRRDYGRDHQLIRTTYGDGATDYNAYDRAGRLSAVTDALHHTTRFEYDVLGRIVRMVDPLGQETVTTYDAAGNIHTITEPGERTTTYTYNAANRLIATTDPEGHTVTRQYDANGNLVALTDGRGYLTQYVYDELDRLIKMIDASGGHTVHAYDAVGNLLSVTDAGGRTTQYEYDAMNRNTVITDAVGGQIINEYDALGQLISTTDQNDNTTGYTYDGLGRLTVVTDPLGNQIITQYDAVNNPVMITDALGNRQRFVYDVRNRQIQVIDTYGQATTSQYDLNGNRIAVIDGLGRETCFEYDKLGRIVKETDALGNITTTVYHPSGMIASVTDPLGHATQFEYDNMNRLVRTIDPLGNETHTTYDASGNKTSVTDETGRTTHYAFDALGRVTTITTPLGDNITSTYDAVGNIVTATDALGRTTEYQYDELNRLVEVIDALDNHSSTEYDAVGNIISTTDSLGRTTTYSYDALDRQTSSTDALDGTTTTAYDAAGNVISITDALGRVTGYAYDKLNRLVASTNALGDTVKTRYDAAGNVIEVVDTLGQVSRSTYDNLNQLIAMTDPLGHVTTTQYDAAGNIIAVTGPLGNTTTLTYDAMGRPITVTDPSGNVKSTNYDAAGKITSVTDELGRTTTYGYDDAGRRTTVTDALGQTTETEYDAVGNIIKITDALGRVTTYDYDSLNRMTTITDAPGQTTSTEYDAAGNIIAVVDALGRRTQYTYDDLNRQTATIDPADQTSTREYDAVGNIVRTLDELGNETRFTYNDLNHISSLTDALNQTTTTEYDAAGNTTAVTDALGRRTQYTYDAMGRLITTTNALGDTVINEYDAGGNLVAVTDEMGHTTQLVVDVQGQVVSVTDPLGNATSNTYDAVGNLIRSVDPLGRETTYTYDEMDRLATQTDALDGTTVNQYDAVGNRLSVTDELGHTTQYTYDNLNQLITITDPLGYTTTSTYDAVGNLTVVTNPLGRTTQYAYDALDRLITTTDALGETVTNQYDAAGNIRAITDQRGNQTQYTYDALGQRITITDALGYTTLRSYDAAGNLLSETDPLGRTTSYTYDNLNRLLVVTDAAGQTRSTEYDAAGNVVAVTDPLGNTAQYQYDALGRLVETVNDLGASMSATYDAVGNIIAATDWLGNETTHQYDNLDRNILTTDALGQTLERTYDAVGNLLSVTDPLEHTTRYSYDALGRVLVVTDALGSITMNAYDAAGNLVAHADQLGHITSYTYDELDRLTAVTDALGNVTTTGYDSAGNVVSVADPLGQVTRYSYDALNQRVSQTDPLGNTSTMAYDAAGNVIEMTDATGQTITLAYDVLNRLVATTDPLGRTTTTAYDGYGNIITITDPLGRTTTSTYDALHRLVMVTDAMGYTTSTTYDAQGNILTITDASGQITTFTYDSLNRRITSTDPLGHTTTTTYDAASNMIAMIDPLGLATHYQYDELDRLVIVTDAAGNATQTQYDVVGNVTGIIDPEGNQTLQSYDANNRLASRTDPLGQIETWQYDANGNMVQATDRNGRISRYQYDANGRRTREIWIDDQGQAVHTFIWGYDENGRMVMAGDSDCFIAYSYDAAGQLVAIDYNYTSGMPPVSLVLAYDDAGNMIEFESLIDGQSAVLQQLTYDGLNQMIRTVQSGDNVSSKGVDLLYNAVGLLDTIRRYDNPNATGTPVESGYTYDDAHRLTDLTHHYGATTINTFDYTYDAGDRLVTFESNDGLAQFQYDDAGQLIDADFDYQDDENYTYDDAGNRTNIGYATGAANRLLSDGVYNYAYDNQGNRISKIAVDGSQSVQYIWDYRNRLTEVVTYDADGDVIGAATYRYDINDRRIEKQVDPDGAGPADFDIVRYVYNGVNITLELDGDNHVTHRYLYGLAADQLFADEIASGQIRWTLSDHQNTIRDLVDSDGNIADHRVYDSFGNITDQTNPGMDHDFGYTGRQLDEETGLYYYRARYYDAPVGRFVSEDPIAFDGGDFNLSRYVFNSPWLMTDPTGHFAVEMTRGMAAVNHLSDMIDQAFENSGDRVSGKSVTGNLIDQFIDQMPGSVSTTFDYKGSETSIGQMTADVLAFNPALNFLNLEINRPGNDARMSAFDEVYEVDTSPVDEAHQQLVSAATSRQGDPIMPQQAVDQLAGMFGIDLQAIGNLPQNMLESMYGNATHYGDTGGQMPSSLGPDNHSDARTNLDAKLMMGQMMVNRLEAEGRLTPDVLDVINDFYKNLLAGNKQQALADLTREQQQAQENLDLLRQQEQLMQQLRERNEQIKQMQPGYDLLSTLTNVNHALSDAGKVALDWSIDKLQEHGNALGEIGGLYDEAWLDGKGGKTLEAIADFASETWDFYADGAVGDWMREHGSALGELVNTCYVEPAGDLLDIIFKAAKESREEYMQDWIDGKGYENLFLAGLASLAEEDNFGATFNTLTMGWGSGNIAKNILLYAGGGPGNKIAQVLNKSMIRTKFTAEIAENAEKYGISKANAKILQQYADDSGLDVSIRWSNVDSLKYAADEVPGVPSIAKPETVKLKTMKDEDLAGLFGNKQTRDMAQAIEETGRGPGLVWKNPQDPDFQKMKKYYENYTDAKGNKIDFNFDEEGFLRLGEDYIHGDYDMSFVINVKTGTGLTNQQTIKLGETLNEITGTTQFQHGSQITWIENITNPSAKGRGIVGENLVFRPGEAPVVLTTKEEVASYLLHRGVNPDAFVAQEIGKQIAGQATVLIYGDTVMAVRQGEAK